MVSSITIDSTTFTRRYDTPRLIVLRFFLSLKKMPRIQLYSISVRKSYTTGLWNLAFTYIIVSAPTVILASSAPMVITSLSVKIRANAYRNQSLNDSSWSTSSCCDVLATVPVIYIQLSPVCTMAKVQDFHQCGKTNRQTDKQTNRQTNKQTSRQTDKQTYDPRLCSENKAYGRLRHAWRPTYALIP